MQRVSVGLLQGTSASCPFNQQQNMLRPTTEYFIKTCLFCCHNQQQNADRTNNRMPIFVAFRCWSCQHSVVDRDNKIGTFS